MTSGVEEGNQDQRVTGQTGWRPVGLDSWEASFLFSNEGDVELWRRLGVKGVEVCVGAPRRSSQDRSSLARARDRQQARVEELSKAQGERRRAGPLGVGVILPILRLQHLGAHRKGPST